MRRSSNPPIPVAVLVAVLATLSTTSPPLAAEKSSGAMEFMNQIRALCGASFEGRIVTNLPTPDPKLPDPYRDQRLLMHVRDCTTDQIRIPFHVGDDRSRTWILSRTENGLKFQQDHRREDGTPEPVTMYGGDSRTNGRASRQEFPADRESRALFRRQNMPASYSSVWILAIEPEGDPNRVFSYELERYGRRFRVDFDLTQRVPNPPPTWGLRAQQTPRQ